MHYPEEVLKLLDHRFLERGEELKMTRVIALGNLAREILKEDPHLSSEAKKALEAQNEAAEEYRKMIPFFYIRLIVKKVCDPLWERMKPYCDYLDLFNEALLSTCNFIHRIGLPGDQNFDPERGLRIISFLLPKLWWETRNYCRKRGKTNLIHVPHSTKKKEGDKKIFFGSDLIGDNDFNEGGLQVFTSKDTDLVELVTEFEELSIVRQAVENCGLDDREKEILKRNSGLNGQVKETMEKIGLDFKVTKERIRQIRAKAEKKLKAYLMEHHHYQDVEKEVSTSSN